MAQTLPTQLYFVSAASRGPMGHYLSFPSREEAQQLADTHEARTGEAHKVFAYQIVADAGAQ